MKNNDFCVTSYGLAASRWLSFVLAIHPKVFVAHGTYELDSIVRGSIESERGIGKDADNYDALERGRELHRVIKRSPLKDLYTKYRSIWPQAEVYGNVHSFVPSELYAKPDIDEMQLTVVNLVRHPVSFVDCHKAIVMQAQQTEELKQHYEAMYAQQVLPALQADISLDLEDYNNIEDIAFLISCFSIVGQAQDLQRYPVPVFQMERLTSDVRQLEKFCFEVTGFVYPREALERFLVNGGINNHRKKEAFKDPEQIYNAWAPHQRQVFQAIITQRYGEVFEQIGYQLPHGG